MRLVDSSTVEIQGDFIEPTKSSDGSPLTDLAYSTIYITSPAGTIKSPQIPASKAAGGGARSLLMLISAPNGAKTTVSFSATSTDIAGNESSKTPPVVFVIDRVGPETPSNFTIG